MKFHYKKLLIWSFVVLFVALGFFLPAVQYAKESPPLIQIQNALMSIEMEVSEINDQVQSIETPTDEDIPNVKLSTKTRTENIVYTIKQTNETVRGLTKKGMDNTFPWAPFGAFFAGLSAAVGTLSSIVLSWRRDLRDAHALAESKLDPLKIVIPEPKITNR
jgi:hypothetical protein